MFRCYAVITVHHGLDLSDVCVTISLGRVWRCCDFEANQSALKNVKSVVKASRKVNVWGSQNGTIWKFKFKHLEVIGIKTHFKANNFFICRNSYRLEDAVACAKAFWKACPAFSNQTGINRSPKWLKAIQSFLVSRCPILKAGELVKNSWDRKRSVRIVGII